MCTPFAGRIESGCGTLVERSHVVGPHAAGVDDRSGGDADRRPVGLDHGTGDATVAVDDLDDAGSG